MWEAACIEAVRPALPLDGRLQSHACMEVGTGGFMHGYGSEGRMGCRTHGGGSRNAWVVACIEVGAGDLC